MRIGIATSAEVDAVWPTVSAKFSEAIDRCGDDLTSGEMWQMCRSGAAFLVVASEEVIKAALVARFERWAEGQVLRILALGGADIDLWLSDGLQFLKEFMAIGEAKRIVFDGRDGWHRKIKARKLRSTYVMEID